MSRGHVDSIISGDSAGDKEGECYNGDEIGEREASITTQSTFNNNYQSINAEPSSFE